MSPSTVLQVKTYRRTVRIPEVVKRRFEGIAVVPCAALGYGWSTGLVLIAILKAIFPSPIGLWVEPGLLYFGINQSHNSHPVHDLSIPVALFLACFFAGLTAYGFRRFRSGRKGY